MTEYVDVPPPDGFPPDEPPPASDDPSCLECGKPLIYAGRGRKPKWCDEHKPKRTSGTHGRKASGDVAQAQAILDGIYQGFTMGLMVLSPVAAAQWNSKLESLQTTNAVLLAGDKDLTRSICKMGQGGGKIAFGVAHLMAIAPVAATVRADFAVRAAERKSKRAEGPQSGPQRGPELVGAGHGAFPNAEFFA